MNNEQFAEVIFEQIVEFIFNSNEIEGYSRHDYGKNSIHFKNHFNAFDYMLKAFCSENLKNSENIILSTHGYLTKNLLHDKESGFYRNCKVYVGNYTAPEIYMIKPLMEKLVVKILSAETEEDCWCIHDAFETIHPFVDGNGRTGRCLLNAMLIKLDLSPVIIQADDRFVYYENINIWRKKNPNFLRV